jgi:hypothetical protein
VLLLLVYRVTIGVDLSDESYYICFVDGWLKTGIKASSELMIHQLADLFVYPAAKLFMMITGNVEGLALLLRCMYLFLSCIAGLSFYYFSRTFNCKDVSISAGIFIISFIPFSLPAPSYNTMGMLAMIIALSTFGTYLFERRILFALASAAAWMVAAISYPSLLIVLLAFLLGTQMLKKNNSITGVNKYLLLCLVFQGLGALLLLEIYGAENLFGMVNFSNSFLQVSDGFSAKLLRAISMLSDHPIFLFICAASIAIGAFWSVFGTNTRCQWLVVAVLSAAMAFSFKIGPVLFFQPHDYIFLLSLTGMSFLVINRLTRKRNINPVISLMLLVGLFAGIVTSSTATNGLFNFAIGGFFFVAVFLLASFSSTEEKNNNSQIAILLIFSAFFIHSSFYFIYGEGIDFFSTRTERVKSGVFSGLLTTKNKVSDLEKTYQLLSTVQGDSVAVLGRLPGIYLLTSMKPKALTTWTSTTSSIPIPKVENLTDDFYSQRENQPDIILDIRDPWTIPPLPSGQKLLSRYKQTSELKVNNWEVKVFER